MRGDDTDLVVRLVAAAKDDLAASTADLSVAGSRTLFDALVCMAAGCDPNTRLVPAQEAGPVPMIGLDRHVGLIGGIAANAAAAHLRDLDDLHWPSVTHPGSVVWPALLAVGAAHRTSIESLYGAAALGYQVCTRAAALLGAKHRSRYHTSTTAGTLGVAVAVAAALDEHTDATVTAVLHAASTLGGTGQALRERSRTAVAHRVLAATAGTSAALQAGLAPAVTAPFTGANGLCAATGTSLDTATLEARQPAAIDGMTVRRHPVTGFAHCLVDAILDLGELPVDATTAIEAQVPAFMVAFTEPDRPVDQHTASWSLAHAAALAVAGRLPAGALAWPGDPMVAAIRERVVIDTREATPPDLAVAGTVRITDGDDHPFAREVPYGHADAPFTDDELVAKAVRFGVATETDAAALLDQLRTMTTTTLTSAGLAVLHRPVDVEAA